MSKRLPITDRRKALRKPQWYRLEALFREGPAQTVARVDGGDVVMCGYLPPENEVAVALVPPAITHEQGVALQKLLEANMRAPVMVLTNNVQLVQLRPIPEARAREALAAGGEVVQFQRGDDGQEPTEGQGPRAEEKQDG